MGRGYPRFRLKRNEARGKSMKGLSPVFLGYARGLKKIIGEWVKGKKRQFMLSGRRLVAIESKIW